MTQTHKQDSQISAVHAGQSQLQTLHRELESKEEVIQRQATNITYAAVKMGYLQGMLQQLQAALRAKELAASLFHVRLLPTQVSSERVEGLLGYCKTVHLLLQIAFKCTSSSLPRRLHDGLLR